MSPREFERKCINRFKKDITLPEKGWFVLNENNMRFCYFFKKEIKYVIFISREQAAAFMHKNNLIDKVAYKEDGVRLFKQHFEIIYNHRKSFTQKPYYEELRWEDVSFSRDQVLHFAARAEYEAVGGIVGHCEAIIIPFTSFIAA